MNPLLKERVNVQDLTNALRHIHTESARVIEAVEKAERSGSGDTEMQFLMSMSGLEIFMTNFCTNFREKFI